MNSLHPPKEFIHVYYSTVFSTMSHSWNAKKTVKKVAKNDVGLMPSSNYPGARNTSGYAPRVYNGLMPSSTYPGFSGSRVNLIE